MPDLSAVTAKIKSIPPVVWLIAGGIVIAVLVISRGGSGGGSSAGTASGAGGSGGGDTPPDIGQQIVDLAASIAHQQAADKAFQQTVLNDLKKTPTPVPVKPPAPTGGPILPIPLPVRRPPVRPPTHPSWLTFHILTRTPIYDAQHRIVGHVSSTVRQPTLQLQKGMSHGAGEYWYKIMSGTNAGKFVLLKPSQVK